MGYSPCKNFNFLVPLHFIFYARQDKNVWFYLNFIGHLNMFRRQIDCLTLSLHQVAKMFANLFVRFFLGVPLAEHFQLGFENHYNFLFPEKYRN